MAADQWCLSLMNCAWVHTVHVHMLYMVCYAYTSRSCAGPEGDVSRGYSVDYRDLNDPHRQFGELHIHHGLVIRDGHVTREPLNYPRDPRRCKDIMVN